MKEPKYSISCHSEHGGHSFKATTITEVISYLVERRNDYYKLISVFDRQLSKHIFWKDMLCSIPEIDLIWNPDRDLRTKTRLVNQGS